MHRNLKRLLAPASIAAIGGRQAQAVIQQCRALGFAGEIWPVHPEKKHVCGLKAYPTIESLPGAPDAAFIGVNRERTIDVVAALLKCNAGGAICYASGFSEADKKGAELQQELIAAAGDMPVIGPNCYGLLNYATGAALWPDQQGGRRLADDEKGVAILTQSSNIALNITMQKRGLPVAYIVTAGNQAQTGLSEIALALLECRHVSALGLHIEGFDDVAGFEAVAVRARALKKPIVAIKVGRSEKARQAAFSHTASLAGTDGAADAFLRRIGIARLKTIPSFLEALKLLHVTGPLGGTAISSLSCSGGEASLMADACFGRKVFFPALSLARKRALSAVLGSRVTLGNPLDYHTYIWADAAKMTEAFAAMVSAEFDLNCLVLDFPRSDRCSAQDWWIAIDALGDAALKADARVAIIASLSENISEPEATELINRNIVPMSGIEEAVDAIEAAAVIGQAWGQPQPDAVMAPVFSDSGAHIVVDEADAKEMLATSNISIPRGQKCRDIEMAGEIASAIGFPVAIKLLGVAHKSEHNGVHLNICDEQTAHQVAADLKQTGKDIYIETMVAHGVFELLVGVVRDRQFGLVLTIASGGVLVEILQDSQVLLLPATPRDIEKALRELKGAVFFDGFRGGQKADLAAVVTEILALQKFAVAHGENLLELDINPLIVCAEGHGAVAADALIKLGSRK